ncbi:MAG: Uma2 family endonuclease [Actinomycetota bacterium]
MLPGQLAPIPGTQTQWSGHSASALYERYRVPEYWFVDLDAERVELYLLDGQAYPEPGLFYPGRLFSRQR